MRGSIAKILDIYSLRGSYLQKGFVQNESESGNFLLYLVSFSSGFCFAADSDDCRIL
jgi:hypothetical protein